MLVFFELYDQPLGAPDVRQAVDLAVQRGVLLRMVSSIPGTNCSIFILLRSKRLVDAEFLLRADDAVLRRLRQVEAGAAGGAQLGDHLLVVRQRDLDLDAGLLA